MTWNFQIAFSVKEQDTQGADNCLLSDVPRKDLKPGLDFVYDKHHTLHAWKELEPQCVSYTTGMIKVTYKNNLCEAKIEYWYNV